MSTDTSNDDTKGTTETTGAAEKAAETATEAGRKAADAVRDTGKRAADQAREAGASARQAAGEVVDEAKRATEETRHRLTDEVKATGRDIASQATSTIDQGASQVASQIGGIANAFRQAGSQLRDEEHENLAHYTDRLGEQVQQVADYLDGKGVRDLASDLEGFARRQPALFLGASLAVGIVAARFLKSSSEGSR